MDGVANLPTLAFGDATALKVGQSVFVVGSPLGARSTARGIVSSLHHSITVSDPVVATGNRTLADHDPTAHA